MQEQTRVELLNEFPVVELPITTTIPERVSEIAPAIAPIFLAIGGGGNYTTLFIAAAMFALFGALSIQPVKGVR